MTTGSRHVERADLLLSAVHAIALGDEDQAHLRSCVACRRALDSLRAALADRRRTEASASARRRSQWDRKHAEILALIQDGRAARGADATPARLDWRRAAVAALLLGALVIPAVEIARERDVVPSGVPPRADTGPTTVAETRSAAADDEWLHELARLSLGTEDEGSWSALAPLPPQEGEGW